MATQGLRIEQTRAQPRFKLPAMYTLLRVRQPGETRYRWSGHIYDVSMEGMRFELDQSLPAGTVVQVRGILPGRDHIQFRAAGRIVRIHDDTSGPSRMAMVFDTFAQKADRERLRDYLAVQTQPEEAWRQAA